MGVNKFNAISKTTKKLDDFNKKQVAGKNTNADQTQVTSLSARIDEVKAKIQNSKQFSAGLQTENISLKNNQELSEKKKHEGPKLKPELPVTQIDKFQEELKSFQDKLSVAKEALNKKMDEAVISGSDQTLKIIQSENALIKSSQELNEDSSEIMKDSSLLKDPELVQKIHNKTTEISNLTLDKKIPGRNELLASAKQELTVLKGQLFSQ